MIIKVKRGTTKPTTTNLANVGEMGFDYNSEALYIRGNTKVVRIGAMELVTFYEGNVSSYRFNHTFDKNYIYKIHVVCSTNTTDVSQTVFEYYSGVSSETKCTGAYAYLAVKDNDSGPICASSRGQNSFVIDDGYTNSVSANYATTKVIDFELSPTQEASIGSTYTWVVQGRSTCCSSDQGTTPITFTQFSHTVDVSIGSIFINPGLDEGTIKTFTLSVYRMRRR